MSVLNPNGLSEVAEPKPTLRLEGTQLALLKLQAPQLGQCVQLCVEACITGINSWTDEKGIPHPSITFDVERVEIEEPEPQKPDPMQSIAAMFPSHKS